MPVAEQVTLWLTIALYAVASASLIVGLGTRAPLLVSGSVIAAATGLVIHSVSLGMRWIRVGHGPSVGFFEVASGLALLGVAAYVTLAVMQPGLRPAGAVVLPVCLVMLGATLLVNPEARSAGGTLASVWLSIHVLFANLAFAFYAAALVLAVGELMRTSRAAARMAGWLDRVPEGARFDALLMRLVGTAFLLQGVMIATGAVWANEAWGRYWAFDPIETWSLLAWLALAVHLHLSLTLGWRGRPSAWVVVVGFCIVLFSLLGVPIVYDSVHAAYLSL